MSAQKWTNEQLEAITARDSNLLVSAAAGAGKTAVLVERLIKIITDQESPVDVDKLLVVTFTKAAAAEMRERTGQAIARELTKNPGSKHLHRQSTLLNRASITTLHSFCLDITRNFFYLLDLDPAFRIADDTEGALLRAEVLDQLFEEKYAAEDKEFLALVDAYGGDRDDAYLKDIVFNLYEFSTSNPWPADWLSGVAGLYKSEPGVMLDNHPWGQAVLSWAADELESYLIKLNRVLALANSPGGPQTYHDTIVDDIAVVEELLRGVKSSWKAGYEAFQEMAYSKLKACRSKDVDERLKERVKKIRDEAKKGVEGLKSQIFYRPQEELLDDLAKMSGLIEKLVSLVLEFRESYQAAKVEKGIVDFSDLEHFCLKVLLDPASTPDNIIPSSVALELRTYYHEVIVDEYQDTNLVQETILSLISRQGEDKPNLFMVGDVKQSIYRFRLADSDIFEGKYRDFQKGGSNRVIDLTRNFRSCKTVVDGVNFVFRQIMAGQVGRLVYDKQAELVCGTTYPQPTRGKSPEEEPVELHILEKKAALEEGGLIINDKTETADGDENSEEESLDAVQREARLIAWRIQQLFEPEQAGETAAQVFDKALGAYRPIQYRDIVILMRATRGSDSIYIEELRKAGIPAYAELGTGYFDATEVETVMSLLRVIDNPRQDIPLAAVLRSPIGGFSAEELAEIRLLSEKGDFYEALVKAGEPGKSDLAETKADEQELLEVEKQAQSETDELGSLSADGQVQAKIQLFLTRLDKWRTMARQGSLADLIWHLYEQTGFYAYTGGMPGGSQRQANLRALYDRALQFEATSFRGLFRFLRFIDKFRESGQDLGTARAIGEQEDVVRIMSIHKSKGLEFPVVFVTGLGRKFNTSDLRRKALLHKELGLGLPVVDTKLRLTYPSLAQLAIKRRLYTELLEEEMRILYVALTRAREKLILVGSVRELPKAVEKWCQNINHDRWALPLADVAAASCFLDWLGPVVARHTHGEPLRNGVGIAESPHRVTGSDSSLWQVHWHEILPELQTVTPEAANEELWNLVRNLEPVPLTAGLREVIDPGLSWQYSYSGIVTKAAKAAVSEVKRKFADFRQDDEALPLYSKAIYDRPAFLRKKKGLSPSEIGTATHIVMQHLDFNHTMSSADVKLQVEALVSSEILTPQQGEAVDLEAVRGFVSSPLGQRVLSAQKVRREIPFTLSLPASKVYEDVDPASKEMVVVQGVIDLLIEEADGLVLIDYKTNRVASVEALDDIAAEYAGQMSLYKMAIEKSLRKTVKEKFLYLFSVGKELKLT